MNKLAIVTGGTRGIGGAITRKFSSEGFDVVATVTKDGNGTDFKNEIEKEFNNNVYVLTLNVGDSSSIDNFISEVSNLDRNIDVVINNAGITNDKLTGRMTEEDFNQVLNINLTGTFLISKHFLKIMSKQKFGKLVNMSSVVGITGNLGQANYSASKAGVIALTKSLSKEFGRKNININAIAPGFIKTDMTEVLDEKLMDTISTTTSLRRLGEASEVAEVAYFLGSESSSYITGQVIVVDGGLT